MQLGLNKLPWYAAMLIALGIGGAGTISYHYLYAGFPRAVSEILPIGESDGTLRASLSEKEMQLARERQDIQKGLDAEKRLVDFREELKNLERQFNDLKVVLPTSATSPTCCAASKRWRRSPAWSSRCSVRRPSSASSSTRSGR